MNTQEILPTDSELEILQILWQHGASTVRFVNDTINQHREVGYTSTLKTMQLMLDKDMLSRTIEDRIHYYIASINEQHTQAGLLDEFVENTFRGSTSSLVLSMLGNSEKTSYEDIQKIKELIREIEQKNFNNASNS
jgi:BlaI family transcriptional regulator, penicillinase repressor